MVLFRDFISSNISESQGFSLASWHVFLLSKSLVDFPFLRKSTWQMEHPLWMKMHFSYWNSGDFHELVGAPLIFSFPEIGGWKSSTAQLGVIAKTWVVWWLARWIGFFGREKSLRKNGGLVRNYWVSKLEIMFVVGCWLWLLLVVGCGCFYLLLVVGCCSSWRVANFIGSWLSRFWNFPQEANQQERISTTKKSQTQRIHGTGMFTYIYHKYEPNVRR